MKQVALTDFETYFETSLDTLSNVTTVGALNSGSITSGFGAIDTGSSNITTTGTVSFGNLTDGAITITAFVDEDNMASDSATLVPTQQSVKAYVDSQIGGLSSSLSGLTDTNITTPADGALLFYDTGTSRWIDNVVSGDITIADTGVAAISSGVIVNADINASAAIDVSKTALTAGTGLTLTTNTLSVDAAQTQITSVGTLSSLSVSGTLTLGGTAVTATATELNLLDATTAELNYTDGVTSNIQTQLDSKLGANYTGDVNITGELLVDSYNETFKKVTSSSNATTVNCENANVFEHVLTENTTFTFSNPPASGTPVVTGQYNFSTASYDSVSLSTGFGTLSELNFNNDGTKLYVVSESTDAIYQYSLSTAYDLSTASYDSVSFSLTSQDLTPNGLVFNGDGTKLYITGNTNDSVFQYSLSTAYDLSTISYDSVSLSVTSQDTSPQGVEFNNDGTKLYVVGASSDSVHQYSLNTAYDLSTASYDSVSFSFSSQDGAPRSIRWNNNGTKLYVSGDTNNTVFQYSLSTAYDISTLSYDSVSFSVASQSTNPYGLVLNGDGTKFYIAEAGNGTVYQYSLGTSVLNDSTAYAMSLKVVQDSGASGYTVTWPTSVDWPSATAPTLTATASAVDQFVFYTYDGGTTWYGFTAGQALG
jgi:DNA-binding beta-propeller fold protein YncE